jgi:hypothetical protein
MGRRALLLAAVGLALISWLPLGVSGVPLDTPDGFMHLGWAVAWAKAVQGGWLWPTWSDLPWAGAGSHALLIYPPLFRLLVGIPLVAGIPPDHALASGLLVVTLINAVGAAVLAQRWLRHWGWRWALLLGAVLNPYFLVNLYVRGAWPEALAQGLLWWLTLGLLGLKEERRWGIALSSAALAGVILSNWNASLLTALIWLLAAGVVLRGSRQWLNWLWSGLMALGVTSPFWLPALLALPTVRPPMPEGLLPGEFFGSGQAGQFSFGRLIWIQAVVIGSILISRWLGWGRSVDPLGRWGMVLAASGLVLMLPVSAPVYELVSPLQRIQFPWRWLSPTWMGALLWCASVGAQPKSRLSPWTWRRGALLLTALAAVGTWFDSLWRFRTNLIAHAPSSEEIQANRKLLACEPLVPCPTGVGALPNSGELSKRFTATSDGRIALSGVPDYSPAAIPESSWNKRLAIFWLPNWPQRQWSSFSGSGKVEMTLKSPTERRLLVDAKTAGNLRLMQWADPRWRVLVKPANGEGTWKRRPFNATRDRQGWTIIPLPAGTWDVALRYRYAS